MSRKNKFFAFVIFSAIIILAYGIYNRKKDLPQKAPAGAKSAIGEPEKKAELIYDAHEKRNPFLPLVSAEGRILAPQASKKRNGEIYAEGIVYDPQGASYAVINGEIVKAGETAGDYQLIRIEPQKIILSKEGKESEIELKKED